jgi:uncharacterized membrane protein
MFKKNRTPTNDTTTASTGRKQSLAKLAGGLPILLLALAAFVVALAGVSLVRHEVGEGPSAPYPSLDFTWFVVFFNLFVLLCCAVHLVGAGLGGRMPLGSSAVAGLLAVATVLTIVETRDWNAVRKTAGHSNKVGKGATTLFAGYIALAVLDGLLILILGNQHDTRRSVETKTYHNHPQGDFPTTTTPVTHNTTGMAHATTTAAPHHNQGVNAV